MLADVSNPAVPYAWNQCGIMGRAMASKSGKLESECGSVTTVDAHHFCLPNPPLLYLVTGPSYSREIPLPNPNSLTLGRRIGSVLNLANHGICLFLTSSGELGM